jgi:hypothetical protein
MDILMPMGAVKNARTADVNVLNFTAFEEMYYRYNTSDGWSANFSLTYNPSTMTWADTTVEWEERGYVLQVFGIDSEGDTHAAQRYFTVAAVPTYSEPLSPLVVLAIGVGVGVFAVLFALFGIPKIREYWKQRQAAKAAESPPAKETKSKKKSTSKKKSSKKKGSSGKSKKGGA